VVLPVYFSEAKEDTAMLGDVAAVLVVSLRRHEAERTFLQCHLLHLHPFAPLVQKLPEES
jgi:hypothetical protein